MRGVWEASVYRRLSRFARTWGGRRSHRKRGTDLYSFGPRETSSGKDPTCCLWLGFIPLLTGSRRRVAGALLVVSNCHGFRWSESNLYLGFLKSPLIFLSKIFCPLWGAPTPPYIGGRGRLTCRVLVGYNLVKTWSAIEGSPNLVM